MQTILLERTIPLPRMADRRAGIATRLQSRLNASTGLTRTPGIQYLVVDATGILFEHAAGWADLRRGIPLDARTTMMAYSMSKTITAAAALQLVEAGRMGLDDRVDRYVDSFPYGPQVTVRQLISHTS